MAEFRLANKYPFLMDKAFQDLSPDLQKQVFAGETAGAETRELGNILREMRDPEFMRQQLQIASAFDKERMKEAAKYKALFDLPGAIMSAVTTPAIIAAQGASNIAAAGMRSSEQIPELLKYQTRNSYNYTPTRYFQ